MSKKERVIGWRVRVYVDRCGALHFLSRTEPMTIMRDGHLAGMHWDIVEGTSLGDTIGHIDWNQVVAVTWRDGDADTFDPKTGEDLALDD